MKRSRIRGKLGMPIFCSEFRLHDLSCALPEQRAVLRQGRRADFNRNFHRVSTKSALFQAFPVFKDFGSLGRKKNAWFFLARAFAHGLLAPLNLHPHRPLHTQRPSAELGPGVMVQEPIYPRGHDDSGPTGCRCMSQRWRRSANPVQSMS